MPEKLMTLQELSEWLQISEEKIIALVDKKVISAYRIGGELLRFRKEQIDAIRSEIDSRVTEADRIVVSEARKKVKERLKVAEGASDSGPLRDKVADFLYFNDFYILSGILVIILLVVIFRG
ncbi:MAG: helix-turn-helix domain-containing protein [Candidatus Omnitrophota bacterium]|nr:helix-turn-helix domain-containing protein [Candidatus Omnitrophota bacterium]